MDRQGWRFHEYIARQFGAVVKLRWFFGAPMLYVYDPVALQHIIKDMTTFDEVPWYLEGNNVMLGPGILSVSGNTHRKQRKMLTPAFAPKHLRDLVPVFYSVVTRLVTAIDTRVSPTGVDLDVCGWMSRTALELIGQSGLGYSFDPLTEETADAYAGAIKRFVPVAVSQELLVLRQALPYVAFLKNLVPGWLLRWSVERLPFWSVQEMLKITDTLHQRSVEILEDKKAAIKDGQHGDAKDVISVLLRANMSASEEDRLPDDELVGQMSSIIFAAMDSTSNAMSRTLHLLAQRPDVQDRLRREILDAKVMHEQELDYDQLHALPFMDAVCRETLRVYTPVVQAFTGTTKDTVLPLSQPVRATDGSLLSSLAIPRGTNVFIAVRASNCNEALWGPDAYEWKPERWLAPLPEALEDAAIPGVYSNLMTFLGGGRSCIGFTFSQLEMKVVLSELIAHFAFELSDKPIVWNLNGISFPTIDTQSTKPEMWLKVRRLGGE
ncbi:cytochrome P450 [Trametes polyzona]|nr:cytochrome P450 [Trametes polyzona]